MGTFYYERAGPSGGILRDYEIFVNPRLQLYPPHTESRGGRGEGSWFLAPAALCTMIMLSNHILKLRSMFTICIGNSILSTLFITFIFFCHFRIFSFETIQLQITTLNSCLLVDSFKIQCKTDKSKAPLKFAFEVL